MSYGGVTLEDLGAFPGDTFQIRHMKTTDLNGNVLTAGEYGWGEVNDGRQWDAGSNTFTYRYAWGSISLQYIQVGDTLRMVVTTTNLASSGVIFDGASIYPLTLHFPILPAGFTDVSYPQVAFNTTAPSVTLADYGSGEVAAVVTDPIKPLYSGFVSAGQGTAYSAVISSTSPDFLATFQPHNDRAISPGQTDTFVVDYRFAPSGTATGSLAGDAYANWASAWPAQLNWNDRRPIGTIYLATRRRTASRTTLAGIPRIRDATGMTAAWISRRHRAWRRFSTGCCSRQRTMSRT